MSYALITPARDEADNLQRLGACLVEQTVKPLLWVVVDNGSTDRTADVVREFAGAHDWVRLTESSPAATAQPGQPIVRAFHTGLELVDHAHVVVKLDADVSMNPNYFERLLAAFVADGQLGIASGECYEERDGEWRATHVTGAHVRGASRAWRWACLQAVLPLDDTVPCVMDIVDELKARSLGWRTGIVPGLSFYHHRSIGERDGGSTTRWARQGRAAHYVGYRFWYLGARAGFRAVRNPAALAMLNGYLGAAFRREPRCADKAVIAELRQEQSLRRFPLRIREALGRRPDSLRTTTTTTTT